MEPEWTAGAWPLVGLGPREAVRPGVVWPFRRDPTGEDGPTHWQCRSGAYRRVGYNLWVPRETPQTVEQRIVEAGARLPSYGAVTGWAALRWMRARWLDGTRGGALRPVELAVSLGNTLRSTRDHPVSMEILAPQHITRVDGLRVTTAVRSVAFEMRKAATDEQAIVAFEMAAYDDLVSIAELVRHLSEDMFVRQGVGRVRGVLPFLDENSWSPMEPLMRATWRETGLGLPLANRPVFDLSGRFIATPDAIDPVAGVVCQYDGAVHLVGATRMRDVRADAALRAAGVEPVVMMAGDLADRRAFCKRLREAYARAARRTSDECRWTLELPSWWRPTHSVELRRALSVDERQRLLSYRNRAA